MSQYWVDNYLKMISFYIKRDVLRIRIEKMLFSLGGGGGACIGKQRRGKRGYRQNAYMCLLRGRGHLKISA